MSQTIPDCLPSVGAVQSSSSVVVTQALKTVGAGKRYSVTSMELYTDSTSGVRVHLDVAGNPVWQGILTSQTPVFWKGGLPISATEGQNVSLVIEKTAVAQWLAYNIGQAEY